MQIAREEGVADFVHLLGMMPRAQALEFLAGATMLLSLPQDTDFAIPAKIYEYLRMPAWILALAHSEGATTRLLEGSGADIRDPADVDGIADAIRARFHAFQKGELPQPIGADGRFDRRVQSDKLLGLIDALG